MRRFRFVAGAALIVAAVTSCGQSQGAANDRAAGASAQAQKDAIAALASENAALKASAAAAASATPAPAATTVPPAPAPEPVPTTTTCGGTVSAGGTTSCAFATNVADAYQYSSSGGTTDVTAFSPVTQQYITMHCVAGVPVVCRGGRDAVVYIR